MVESGVVSGEIDGSKASHGCRSYARKNNLVLCIMGFLHKLWDETLAGPTPDTGLGKLRKYNSFSPVRSPPLLPDQTPVSRTITIRRTSTDCASIPDSPAGLSAPGTPVTPGTPRYDFKRFTRRRWETDDHQSQPETPEPTSPTVFDWIIITGLDR